MKNLPIPVALFLGPLMLAPAAYCEEEPTLLEAFTKGSPVLNLRYRYENINDEFDFQFLYTAHWKQGFGLKGTLYFADEFSTDTKKFWVFTT